MTILYSLQHSRPVKSEKYSTCDWQTRIINSCAICIRVLFRCSVTHWIFFYIWILQVVILYYFLDLIILETFIVLSLPNSLGQQTLNFRYCGVFSCAIKEIFMWKESKKKRRFFKHLVVGALFVGYKFKYVLPLFSTLPFRLYVDQFENVPFTLCKIFTKKKYFSKTTFTPNVMVIHKEYIICVAYLPCIL